MCSIVIDDSIDWFKGKISGKSHISWENLWFPVDFPSSQPIEKHTNKKTQLRSTLHAKHMQSPADA